MSAIHHQKQGWPVMDWIVATLAYLVVSLLITARTAIHDSRPYKDDGGGRCLR